MAQHAIFHYTMEELQRIRTTMVAELQAAAAGENTSFTYATHHLDQLKRGLVAPGEAAQVIVIGGSNLICALIRREDGDNLVERVKKTELPPLRDRETLLSLLYETLDPHVRAVAINFAYPITACYREGKLDGRLLHGTKEHAMKGLEGHCVGEAFEQYVEEQDGRSLDVVVANDTVCLVLAGLEDAFPNELIGGVIGTGVNFGLFTTGKTVVNLEAGGFATFSQTDTGKEIDAASNQPGVHRWEKEVAGGYLYKHYNIYARQLGYREVTSTVHLSNLSLDETPEGILARAVLHRSARLAATQMAALFDFKDQKHATFVIEGTLFWNGWNYKQMVYDCLEELGITLGLVRVIKIERSYLLGAARLLLAE